MERKSDLVRIDRAQCDLACSSSSTSRESFLARADSLPLSKQTTFAIRLKDGWRIDGPAYHGTILMGKNSEPRVVLLSME